MAGALRRARLGAPALPALVGLSTLLHWLAGRRIGGLWIMPDEAIYADRGLTFWQHGPFSLLHGPGAGYGVLYPVLAGFPLAVGGAAHGYASLKLLQALVVSLAAVPVFTYARRLMPARWALLAAALTSATPLLLYSGLVMTEVLFYPLAALTLLAAARAVETAALRDQAIALVLVAAAILTRVQAVVFVPVLAAAIAVDTIARRDRTRLRAFWPVWAVLVASGAALVAAPSVVGSYAVTLRGSYPLAQSLGLVADHAAYLVLSTGIVPAATLLLLVARALRGREQDPAVRAFSAVTISAVVLLTAQVGFFAARYSHHLLGRDLSPLPPLLFISLALWCARGAPRPRIGALLAALIVGDLLFLVPWGRLVTVNALPDTFEVAVLQRVHEPYSQVVDVAAVLALVLFLLLPRRVIVVLPLLLLGVLVTGSVVASSAVSRQVASTQAMLVGSPRDWVDRSAQGDVAYVYDGELQWVVVWQTHFWNTRLNQVVALRPFTVPGPLEQTQVAVPPDGRLPIAGQFVVAADPHAFVGEAVAHHALPGAEGLTLWRLTQPARLSSVTSGVQPNGDITGRATVDVYDCTRGTLELTLLPKATNALRILLGGKTVLRANIGGRLVWHASIAVPHARRVRKCRFTILGGPLLGSTRIAFVR